VKRSWFAIAIAIAVVLAIGILWWSHRGAPEDLSGQLPALPTVAARYGSVEQTVALNGRAGPSTGSNAKLAFGVAGTIQRVDVAVGDRVARGSVVAQLDDAPYALAAAQSQAQVQAQSAGAAAAAVDRVGFRVRADEAALRRQRVLYGAGVVALKDMQAAQAAVDADRADARVANDQTAQAAAQASGAAIQARSSQADLARTTLRAPYNGTVSNVAAVAGETIDATTTIVTVVPDAAPSATLDVSFAQIDLVHAGDVVHLRAGDERWQARVEAVSPGVDAGGLGIVRVSSVPSRVAPGTPIDGTVVTAVSHGIIVPLSAVVEDPESGQEFAFVQAPNGGHFSARRVVVDARDERFARIASGLRAGERVASQGAIDLLQQ
jgi:RND family efflux transporter MFP subunit